MPSCAHPINNALVRREWGWDGFFISDCNAIEHFCAHNYSLGRAPGTNAWAALVQGGIDYNCGSFYQDQLLKQVQAGAINQTDVDTAVRRVLKTMFRLGDPPPPPPRAVPGTTAAHADCVLQGCLIRWKATSTPTSHPRW